MANLKDDLNDYLLQSETQKRGFKISMPTFSTPRIFSRSEEQSPSSSTSSWFAEAKSEYCSLTRTQRFIGFATCMMLGLLCFILSTIYIPVLLLKARKFALLYTLGSMFFIFSFSFLYGPWTHCKQLFSKERVLTTIIYGSTLIGTLYCALHLQSTPLTIVCAVAQVIALFWIIMGSIPGGSTGMRFFGSMFKSSVSNTLPI